MNIKNQKITEIIISLSEEEAIFLRDLLGKLSDKQVLAYWTDRKKANKVNEFVDDLFHSLEDEV